MCVYFICKLLLLLLPSCVSFASFCSSSCDQVTRFKGPFSLSLCLSVSFPYSSFIDCRIFRETCTHIHTHTHRTDKRVDGRTDDEIIFLCHCHCHCLEDESSSLTCLCLSFDHSLHCTALPCAVQCSWNATTTTVTLSAMLAVHFNSLFPILTFF